MRHRVDALGLGLKDFADPTVPTPFAEKPERQRKGWSFLTWAFFLPHLAASDVFFGKGAKAAVQDEAHSSQQTSATTGMESSNGDLPHTGASVDPGELATPLLGGSASYNNQPINAALVTDAQQVSGAWGLKVPAEDTDPESSGGGGGGSELGDFGLDPRSANENVT
jgi:hypothetical protein